MCKMTNKVQRKSFLSPLMCLLFWVCCVANQYAVCPHVWTTLQLANLPTLVFIMTCELSFKHHTIKLIVLLLLFENSEPSELWTLLRHMLMLGNSMNYWVHLKQGKCYFRRVSNMIARCQGPLEIDKNLVSCLWRCRQSAPSYTHCFLCAEK